MGAPVMDFKITFRPGFQSDMDTGFEKLQSAFSQHVADTIDPYVPFASGTLKGSVKTASDFKGGTLVYNTPYARRQYYLHEEGTDLHGDTKIRGSYWGQRAVDEHKAELETFAHNAARQFLGGGT